MITFIALISALSVFTLTPFGVFHAVGPDDAQCSDIFTAAGLVRDIYFGPFNIKEPVATPLSYFLLAMPAILTFFAITTLFGSRHK